MLSSEAKLIRGVTRGDERAFYGVSDTKFENCKISGAEDGESAFKESRNIDLSVCNFDLRYPLWHTVEARLDSCYMADTCRAPIWYSSGIALTDTEIKGVKAVRECREVSMKNCRVVSAEFGWKTSGFTASFSDIEGEYLFLDSEDISLDNVRVKGKYSFQYVKNAVITNCVLDTKDAFWHGENITVIDSVVSGEYLGWYSKNLRLIRCVIKGTQPLCYAEGLTLEDCTMEGCDLSFENSTVNATVIGAIDSIKNPSGGSIIAGDAGDIISEDVCGRTRKTLLTLTDRVPKLETVI
ncbi:MAG: DUF3737 family protein [Clostridia bacterium]|nr:DUF3737 family protein [Clostridia bacterium]